MGESMNKYKNKKVIVTADGTMFETEQLKQHNITDVVGINFDSKMEAEYYLHIKRFMGNVKSVTLQPDFILQEKPKIVYKADFLIHFEDGKNIIVDVKGFETQAFRIKMRLFKAKFPDKVIMLVKREGKQWISKLVG